MRTLRSIGIGALALAAACQNETLRPPREPSLPVEQNAPPVSRSPYRIADVAPGREQVSLPLADDGSFGIAVHRHRFVVGADGMRSAADLAPTAIVGTKKIPARLGGGFLFWTSNSLYRATSFDARLAPIAKLSENVESVTFGPSALVVHGSEGGRWGFHLPDGARAPLGLLAMTEVAALDDGRALAFSDQGSAFSSTDHGAHWTDITAQLKSLPRNVAVVDGAVWIFEGPGASRLERDGRLAWFEGFDAGKPAEPPRDPRWHGDEPPLRAVFRAGLALDDATSVVVNGSDLVRVDLRTGAILSTTPGPFPPDALCTPVSVPGDILVACATPTAASFVVARVMSPEPSVERTFAGGGSFVVGDDGGFGFTGACRDDPAATGGELRFCVRQPGGGWEERDTSGVPFDGGAPDVRVGRWVPRADGHAVALLVGTPSGIYDPATHTVMPFDGDVAEIVVQGTLPYSAALIKKRRGLGKLRGLFGVVDSSWTFASGNVLRGWRLHGGPVELRLDGHVAPSPYAFDVAPAGPFGLGWSSEGRLYQTSDHGASWTEVEPPPAGVEAFDAARCSSAGCDLGAFYRVGWPARPASPRPLAPSAPPAPTEAAVRGLELTCRPRGAVVERSLPRTASSPDDLGLGVTRLPVAGERAAWAYVRNTHVRAVVSPVRSLESGAPDEATGLRAVFSGFGTTNDAGDVIRVNGPNRSALALRRDVAFVAPFDPAGRIVRTSIAVSDFVAAGKRAGLSMEEMLADDPTETAIVVPVLPPDGGAASDVAVHNPERGSLAILRGGRVRVEVRPSATTGTVVSGAMLSGDESAWLELEGSGVGRVFKVGQGGVVDAFEVNAASSETSYPTNPDALAVGPKGELVILRTPSGREPASKLDPAFVFAPGMAPVVLAPWSELKLADDPACTADPSGYRAVVGVGAPWIRVANPELRVEEAPMLVRVRWSPKRVCLESFEVKVPSVSLRVPNPNGGSDPTTIGTWLIGKGSSFGRVGVSEGIEWRQPLECSIVSPAP